MNDANWWKFSIDPEQRAAKIINGANGLHEVNPMVDNGRRLVDYGDYLGLDKLFAAQIPASETPDERVFISTHHHFEIAFKQMIFDLTVIARTFERVLNETNEQEFRQLCFSETEREDFWRPALTAANRLEYTARAALPMFFHFLDKSEDYGIEKGETFSSREYFKFRPFLPPASGFQSAQFRLIQRAFGKAALFRVRLFPAQEYSKDYTGKDSADLIEITDRVVLREDRKIADPEPTSPLAEAAAIDDLAHRVLTRLARSGEIENEVAPINTISETEIETAVNAFRRILSLHRKDQEKIGEKPAHAERFDRAAVNNFDRDLRQVAAAENQRRNDLLEAKRAAADLRHRAPSGNLTKILNRLAATDAALFGQHESSFLSMHLKMAADRIRELQEFARAHGEPEQPAGTGGGGVPYLINMRSNLIGLFPFLIAFRD